MFILNSLNVAYIDPSSVSIVISSIAGVAVAIGATVTILWRKAKKKVANVLHIDENANKEVEDDLVVNDEELNAKVGKDAVVLNGEDVVEIKRSSTDK